MSVSVLTVYQALATTCDYIISCKKIRYEDTVDSDTMDSEEDRWQGGGGSQFCQ